MSSLRHLCNLSHAHPAKALGSMRGQFRQLGSKVAVMLTRDFGYWHVRSNDLLESSHDEIVRSQRFLPKGLGCLLVAVLIKQLSNRSAKRLDDFRRRRWSIGINTREAIVDFAGILPNQSINPCKISRRSCSRLSTSFTTAPLADKISCIGFSARLGSQGSLLPASSTCIDAMSSLRSHRRLAYSTV